MKIAARNSCPKHKLWRAFVDGFMNNDEKVASCNKHTQLETRVLDNQALSNTLFLGPT